METITKEKLLSSFVEVKSIYLHGRRWFQRSYGNTYHTCEIWVNGRLIHKIPFTYGYGDLCVYNGAKWLADNGYGAFTGFGDACSKTGCHPSGYCREAGIEYIQIVTDVKRKRDL